MNFDWREEGFLYPPVPTVATGAERLYRASDGTARGIAGNTDRPGVCFSLDRARSRWHAEKLYSAMEHGNRVTHITEFCLPEGTPLWIGKVHPGDPRAILGNESGSQVYIEREFLRALEVVGMEQLPNDLAGYHLAMQQPQHDA